MKFLEPLGFAAAGTGREGTPPRCLFFLMQEGSSTWKSFICTPNSAAELLSGGCSRAKTLLLLPRVTWLYGKGCLWPEKSLNPKPQRCSRVSLEWISSQAHQGHSERLELQAKPELDNLLFGFLEQEKMSCPHFEFRYCSECGFNLIWFKQGLESQPPKSLK